MMQIDNVKIFCPSVRLPYFAELQKSVSPINVVKVNGTGYTCFSKLLNKCIVECNDEIVIIANDKARPTKQHVEKMLNLLSQGFGFVALYRLGFFAFHKDLIRRIGFFDERFVGGGYEDNDFFIRLKINNIAIYVSEEIPYIKNVPTMWNYKLASNFYNTKYKTENDTFYKLLPEQQYSYDIGPDKKTVFKDWTSSVWTRDAYHVVKNNVLNTVIEPYLPLNTIK